MKEINTAKDKLDENVLHDTWTNILKSPGKYMTIDPYELLKPAFNCPDCKTILNYLKHRYWQ